MVSFKAHSFTDAEKAGKDMRERWAKTNAERKKCSCAKPILDAKYGRAFLCRRCGFLRVGG